MTDEPQKPADEPKEQKRTRKPRRRAKGEGSVFKRSGDRTKPWVAQILFTGRYLMGQPAEPAHGYGFQEFSGRRAVWWEASGPGTSGLEGPRASA